MTNPSVLLDPAFVRELELLRRRLEVNVRSGAAGERTSRRRGGSAEFLEHRPYAPGDDPRRVDWSAFARTGEPVSKVFRAEEDSVLRLLLDASASSSFGQPPKFEVARKVAAAIGYLALAAGQRTELLVARDVARPLGSARRGLDRVYPPRRGRDSLAAFLRDLSQPSASGSADLALAIDHVVKRSRRPGLLVILSDFFDGGAVTRSLTRAAAAGHELALVQVLAHEELAPSLEGDYRLIDSETNARVELSVDAEAVTAYLRRLTGLVEELREWCKRHRASYVRVTNDAPLADAVRRFVARAID